MSIWVLIFIVQVEYGDYRGGTSVSVTPMPLFQSQEACQEAGRKLVNERKNGPIERLTADWSCIQSR